VRGRTARAEQHGDRPACRRVVDMDRQETALVVMGIEQRELLRAVNDIHRIVNIKRHCVSIRAKRRKTMPKLDVPAVERIIANTLPGSFARM
jgi:hypothetical protein